VKALHDKVATLEHGRDAVEKRLQEEYQGGLDAEKSHSDS